MIEVSVIVPNFNHAKYLRKRMDSILSQTYREFELIILDDCSSDDSKTIIEEYRGNPLVSHIVYNDANSGSTFRQWNKGLDLAGGELIWIAESDDWCEPTFLEKTVQKMAEYPTAGLVYTQSMEFEETTGKSFLSFQDHSLFSETFLRSYFAKGRSEIMSKLAYENTIPNASAVLFRRTIYEKAGGADETMKLCGDWFLWTRMLFHSDVYFIAEPLNYFRLTAASARSRFSPEQTFPERMKVLHYIKEHHVKAGDKAAMKLIQRLINSYRLMEIKKPIQTIWAQKKLIWFPEGKIALALFLSLFHRVFRKMKRHPASALL